MGAPNIGLRPENSKAESKSTALIVSAAFKKCGEECGSAEAGVEVRQDFWVHRDRTYGDTRFSAYIGMHASFLDIKVEEYNVPGLVWAEHYGSQGRIGLSAGLGYRGRPFEVTVKFKGDYNFNGTKEPWLQFGVNYYPVWEDFYGFNTGVGFVMDMPLRGIDHEHPGSTSFYPAFLGLKMFGTIDILK